MKKRIEIARDATAPAKTGRGRNDSRHNRARDESETRERKRTSAKKYDSRADRWLEGGAGFTCPVAKKVASRGG